MSRRIIINRIKKNGEVFTIKREKSLYDIYQDTPEWFDYDCGANNWRQICSNEKCVNCYNRTFSCNALSKYWIYDKNVKLPREVCRGSSSKKYWIICPTCNHQLNISPDGMNKMEKGNKEKEIKCRYCCIPAKELCENSDCNICLKNSAKYLPNISDWNDKRDPRLVFKHSNDIINFCCKKCGHLYLKKPNKCAEGVGCPFCSNQKRCDSKCIYCYNNSLSSLIKDITVLDLNKDPLTIAKGTDKINLLAKCKRCNHEWPTKPAYLNYCNNCPACMVDTGTNLCLTSDCKLCLNRSFSINIRSKYHIGDEDLRLVRKGSGKKLSFECEYGHPFEMAPRFVTKGRWCPKCKHKTEKLLYEYLVMFNSEVIFQSKYDWSINESTGRYLSYDFCLEEYKLIIELDGGQHLRDTYMSEQDIVVKRDILKIDKAILNGYSVVRIPQEDVWNNRYNWKDTLISTIKKYNEPKIIFIDKFNDYSEHKKLLLEESYITIVPIEN